MTFEHSDDSEQPGDYPNSPRHYTGGAADEAFPSPDLLPYTHAQLDQPDNASPDELSPADMSYQQLHFVDGRAYVGEHPDPLAREQTETFGAIVRQRRAEVAVHLELTPNANARYSDALIAGNEVLRAAFGATVADTPTYVIHERAFTRAGNIADIPIDNAQACVLFDNILFKTSIDEYVTYGTNVVLQNYLHEGVHRAGPHYDLIISQKQPDGGYAFALSGSAYIHHETPEGIVVKGSFAEEGICEAFRVRECRGTPLEVRCSDQIPLENVTPEINTLLFVPDGSKIPNYDARHNTVAIPWSYAVSVATAPDGSATGAAVTPNGLAGYAYELLDEHLPGLYADMLAGRTNEAAREAARQRIATVDPSLPDILLDADNSYRGFVPALIAVQRALGVLRRPVGIKH